ncbi:hypothetical protein VNO77_05819 [Canavalia gladiata]|uniref:Uncharacterized protein n=1 Tax=Canavalia gladiata TaxID=3824 RepID=A0AAN9N4R7_CANGL
MARHFVGVPKLVCSCMVVGDARPPNSRSSSSQFEIKTRIPQLNKETPTERGKDKNIYGKSRNSRIRIWLDTHHLARDSTLRFYLTIKKIAGKSRVQNEYLKLHS